MRSVQLEPNLLRIAVPSKGRLQEPCESLLRAAGIRFRKQDRALVAQANGLNAVLLFLRPDDIPLLVAEGAADLGIVGQDLVHEHTCQNRVQTRLELGFGRCRLSLAATASGPIKSATDLRGKKVATSMINTAREYFRAANVDVQLLEVNGSVELMVALGLADAIIDLVESGDTLRAAGLTILDNVLQTEAVMIQNPKPRDPKLCDLLVRRLQGVLTAQQYTLLEYNILRANVKQAELVAPGFNSPTISPCENPDWVAVEVMIPKKSSIEIIDKLEALGASAILETEILNCRL